MTDKQGRRWSIERVLVVGAIAAGLAAGTYGIASAANGSSSSQSSTASSLGLPSIDAAASSSNNDQHPWGRQRSDGQGEATGARPSLRRHDRPRRDRCRRQRGLRGPHGQGRRDAGDRLCQQAVPGGRRSDGHARARLCSRKLERLERRGRIAVRTRWARPLPRGEPITLRFGVARQGEGGWELR